jgi:hypothetical protein
LWVFLYPKVSRTCSCERLDIKKPKNSASYFGFS